MRNNNKQKIDAKFGGESCGPPVLQNYPYLGGLNYTNYKSK